ncbi:RTA1 like protein-domain-containing protein [Pseudomassariella vexata]|uniref:RTA1 like protein-domain-containing protein n=1 Tax=Pseudomassariella vexata TaxID=1141098 RepID=A0A1Y2DUP1_9PEZI|nr:RTA1 like protein-domain-containing protein [Pseudomassariella vexata]ORY62990.1 RTA1 like protein-domain-containing protein [Pseudomassariella vexata]
MAITAGCASGNCPRDIVHYVAQSDFSLAGNVALLALFGVLIPIVFILGITYRSSVFATTIITGLALEVMGYIGRVLLALNNRDKNDFILSYVGTIIGPVFFCLAIFRLMPRIVAVYGDLFAAWRPAWHNVVFYAFTTVCLVLQAVGAILSTTPHDEKLVDIGVRVLVAGLAIQVSSLLIFAALGFRFAIAVRSRHRGLDSNPAAAYNTPRFKAFLLGISLATVFLTVRTLYRIVPVSEGFTSPAAENEVLFLVLDGVFVFIAAALLLASFPGRMLSQPEWPKTSSYSNRISVKPDRPYRPAPVHLTPTSGSSNWNRMSTKSNGQQPSPHKYSPRTPKHSPRTPPVPPRNTNMVDSDALW